MIWAILVIAAVSALGLFLYKQESKKLLVHFNKIASQYNGQIKSPLISYPQLTFSREGTDFLLTCMPSSSNSRSNNAPSTSISFYFQNARDIKMRVNTRGLETVINKTFGAKTVDTLNIDFDKAFMVTTEDQDLVHALLTNDVLDGLLQLQKSAPVELQIQQVKTFDGSNWAEKPRCLISLDIILMDDDAYELLIKTSLHVQRNILNI